MSLNLELPNQVEEHERCDICGSALVLRHVGKSAFWGCESYPKCRFTKATREESSFEAQPIPNQVCPDCGSAVLLKKGRYGFFIGCQSFPACNFVSDPSSFNQQGKTIQCPLCLAGKLLKRTSRFGSNFYGCDQYPKCRYTLNDPPVEQSCADCQWPVLIRVKEGLKCPQKNCSYSLEQP